MKKRGNNHQIFWEWWVGGAGRLTTHSDQVGEPPNNNSIYSNYLIFFACSGWAAHPLLTRTHSQNY